MELRVEFCGEEFFGSADTVLSFGRKADIVVDESNRFLHRVTGTFRYTDTMWWLANVGSSITLTLADAATPSSVRLTPGVVYPIAFESSVLRFETGGATYELDVDLIDVPATWRPTAGRRAEIEIDDLSAPTRHPGDVELSHEQFVLLSALARPMLTGAQPKPTNRQLASELGWTITKYNRKLDALCQKFAANGLAGLHGSNDLLAKDRRWRLAQHAVETGLVPAPPNQMAEPLE